MSKSAIQDATRGTIFYVDPDRVTIVGRDTEDGPEHPLYDNRALRDPDPAQVANIRAYGVKCAAKIRKNGKHVEGPYKDQDILEIIDGRGRAIDCREAFRLAKKAGEEPPRLKVEFERSDEDTQVGIMISMNECRHADTPLNRARKAARVLASGQSVKAVAIMFNVTRQAVSQWSQLLELSKKVQNAVDQGKLAASAAVTLRKLSHEEQDAKLEELLKSANGKRPTAKQTRNRVNPDRPQRLTKSVAKKLVEDEKWIQNENLSDDAAALVRFLAGDQEALKEVHGLARAMRRAIG